MDSPFEEMKKWQNDLSVCIRCGYCYELCHLMRKFDWETDTPRGKLLLIYGLINGDIEPTEYISEKVFECFFCKNCEKSCSANVPVTDILKDAKAALIEAGFEVEGVATQLDEDLCSRCGLCVSVCKAEASTQDEEGNVTVDKAKCEGCGVCIATCPSGAVFQREGFGVSKTELLDRVLSCLVGGA